MSNSIVGKVGERIDKANEKLDYQDPSDDSFCDCVRYFFFLIMFTVMCMCGRTLDDHNYWIATQFHSSIQGGTYSNPIGQGNFFQDMTDIGDMYGFFEQIAMPLLYVNYSYNNERLSSTEYNFALGQNKLLGGVRLTLIRSVVVECVFDGIPEEFSPCYPEYSPSNTNTSDYWVAGHEMPYMTASEARSNSFSAKYLRYEGDGNVFDLDPNPTEAQRQLRELWFGGLVDRDARVLFFDFVTLNPNLNLHTVGRLSFELPTDGGVIAYSQIKTWRFWKYLGTRGRTLFAVEIIVTMMVVFYTWEELIEIYTQGFKNYRQSAWNAVDWANLIFFYLTIFWRVSVVLDDNPSMTNLENYESYRSFVWSFSMEAYFNMVNGILLYFKLFKFLNASRKMRLLFNLFYKTAADMFTFIIILCVFYLAYGLGGYLVFSSDVSDFRELHIALLNLFRYTVTDMDYEALRQSSVVAASIYYVSWTLLILLVLVNVIVAILSDGFEKVQEENRKAPDERFIFTRFIPAAMRSYVFSYMDSNKDGYLSAEEFALAHGIEKKEAEDIIAKYDINGDGLMDAEEFNNYLQHTKLSEKQ